MVELTARDPLAGLALPQGRDVTCEALSELRVHLLALPPGAARPDLPGAGESAGPWLNIGPREWLHVAAAAPDEPFAVEIGHGLFGIALSGPGVTDLLAGGCGIDFTTMAAGAATRTRLGEIAVVLHRLADDRFHLFAGAAVARYLLAWIARHVDA